MQAVGETPARFPCICFYDEHRKDLGNPSWLWEKPHHIRSIYRRQLPFQLQLQAQLQLASAHGSDFDFDFGFGLVFASALLIEVGSSRGSRGDEQGSRDRVVAFVGISVKHRWGDDRRRIS